MRLGPGGDGEHRDREEDEDHDDLHVIGVVTHDLGEDDLIEDEFRPGSGALTGGIGRFGGIGAGLGGGRSRRGLF